MSTAVEASAANPARDTRPLVVACLALGVADLVYLNLAVFPRLLAPERAPVAIAAAPVARPVPAAAPVAKPVPEPPQPDPDPAPEPEPAPPPAPVRAPVPAPAVATAIHFPTGQTTLNARNRAAVDALAARALRDPALILAVEGHADARGDASTNERLSQLRARAVARRLEARGVPSERLKIAAFGATRPAADGQDAQSLRLNRRAEILIEGGSP